MWYSPRRPGFAWSVSVLDKRKWVQWVFTIITNGYMIGFLTGGIYTGQLKTVCVPGLSCYSCPGAFGACPIGAFQSVLGSRDFRFTFYVSGFLLAVGVIFGRFICGWLCPFGLIQDLIYKIPLNKKYHLLKGDSYLKFLKYGILVIFVILFPLFVLDITDLGQPGFCKWICPSGTIMAGWPLVLINKGIRNSIGFLFAWKSIILAGLLFLSLLVYRPFCRYLCPLGAIYGFFNPISFYRFRINENNCIKCSKCKRTCKFNISVYDTPNSMECIRCGDCIKVCPQKAIEKGIAGVGYKVYDKKYR